jgi:hypothetical protein
MIIAVLIFRMCDNYRKKYSDDEDIQAQRRYSQYLIAAIIGEAILKHFGIGINSLTHINFNNIKDYFDNNRDKLYADAEQRVIAFLSAYFNNSPIAQIDGRSLAAAFRRFDFVENILALT